MAGITVAGDLYYKLDGQLFEIKRQLRQPTGYPFDPCGLQKSLQLLIEGGSLVEECFFDTEELSIPVPALPHPTLEEVREKFSGMEVVGIERDTSPTTAGTLNLATILHSNEKNVDFKEYERRTVDNLYSLYGFQHALWLMRHQDEFPVIKTLAQMTFTDCSLRMYISFSGLVTAGGEKSYRGVFFLNPDKDGHLDLGWRALIGGFGRSDRLAYSSS